MQIKQLAYDLKVSVNLIKKCLKSSPFAAPDRDFASTETDLTRDEETCVRKAAAEGAFVRDHKTSNSITHKSCAPDPEVCSGDIDDLPASLVAPERLRASGREAFPIFIHQEIFEWLEDPKTPVDQRKILTRRVQELMAYGRATRMKGVRGKNQGWLRTPIGGNSGNQFYLWLSNQGEAVRGQEAASRALHETEHKDARFLRLVRHHDDTRDMIDVGEPHDYDRLPADKALAADADGLVEPLVEAQRSIAFDRTRVRVLEGRPGSGKTTSLQAAASSLTGQALYVTWSPTLANRAKEWFAAFAPAELDVEVWTFRQFIERLDPTRSAPPELPLSAAVEMLREELEQFAGRLGAWRHHGELRAEELFAELHAYVVGSALPVSFRGRRACCQPTLGEADYRQLRSSIGDKAIESALFAIRKLSRDKLTELFPGPMSAFQRAIDLQKGSLALGADFHFDWVLADEVQDLTLVEQWLLVDVAARSGRARGVKPGMVLAGDEAQTVRPTAFEFGPLSTMLEQRLAARTERVAHELQENLRSPETIAKLIERAYSELYGLLRRNQRPRGRRSDSPTDVTIGRVAEVEASGESLRRVMELFAARPGDTALVYPGAVVPADVQQMASDVRLVVWTSETIKGLEFRVVGVLDVPAQVRRIEELASAASSNLTMEFARTSIDRFIVALSRSTESLVLIGADWTVSSPVLKTLCGQASEDKDECEGHLGRVSIDELPTLIEMDAIDSIMQIDGLLTQSEQLQNLGKLEDARRLAENARGLVGTAGRPGSAGKDLRRRVFRRLAQVTATQALFTKRFEMLREAARSYHSADEKVIGSLMTALLGGLSNDVQEADTWDRVLRVAEGLPSLAADEPSIATLAVQCLRDRFAAMEIEGVVPRQRSGRVSLVGALRLLANEAPSDREVFREAHQAAVHRLLRAIVSKTDKLHHDEFVELRISVDDERERTRFDAEHAEARGEFVEASACWERVEEFENALRCSRRAFRFGDAARLAEKVDSTDVSALRWASELDELLRREPPTTGALGREEVAHLRVVLDRATALMR